MFFLSESGAPNPPLDGVTPVFMQVGADPTIAPGLDLPPGSIAKFGADWYWKFDQGATDWQVNPFGGGGSVPTNLALVADWALGAVRYYAVGAGGSDAAAGFSDVSAAAAWAVRKATWAGLLEVLPRIGDNRVMQISFSTPTVAEAFAFKGFAGWAAIHLVATTDGSDNAADRLASGFVVSAAGSGVGGRWTVAAGAAARTFSKSDAAALPTEALGVGRRVRFLGNVTAALVGATGMIRRVNGAAITVSADLPAVPAAGDEFFIERPGAEFTTVTIGDVSATTFAVRGLRSAGSFTVANVWAQTHTWVGCDAVGSMVFQNWGQLATTRDYRAADAVVTRIGVGVHALSVIFRNGFQLSGDSSAVESSFTFHRITAPDWGTGCVALSPDGFAATIESCGESRNSLGTQFAGWEHMRLNGRITIAAFQGILEQIDIQNAPSPLVVQGDRNRIRIKGLTGVTGNTGYALHLEGCADSWFDVDAATTLTAATADIHFTGTGDPRGSFADLALTNVIDANGNNVQGTAGHVVGESALVTNDSGVALTPGMAVYFSIAAADEILLCDASVAAGAAGRCDGIVISRAAAAAGSRCFIATGGRPYVLNTGTTVAQGFPAWVSTLPGILTGDRDSALPYGLRAGLWSDGTDGIDGHVVFHPQTHADIELAGLPQLFNGAAVVGDDTILAVPAFSVNGGCIRAVGLYVINAAGNVRVQIYEHDPALYPRPGALLAESASTAAVAGEMLIPLVTPFVVAPGTRFHISVNADDAALTLSQGSFAYERYASAHAFGAAPDPYPAGLAGNDGFTIFAEVRD